MECHVSVGIGVKGSAGLAGRTKGAVSTWRKQHGLKTNPAPSPRWLSLEERTKRLQKEAFVREQKSWLKADKAVCWSKHSEYRNALAIVAYNKDHERNKERSRRNSRNTWEKRKEDVLWMERRKQLAREYRKKHPQKCKERIRRWRVNNPQKWKEYKRNRRERQKADPVWRAMRNIRKRVREVLKGKRAARSTVGCSRNEFMRHIESKFTNGMHWNNYGTYWHLDHVVPLSHFDLSDPYQAKMANHWTNLQPLEAEKNIEKSNTIQGNVQCSLPL
jgi:hypothetical protein